MTEFHLPAAAPPRRARLGLLLAALVLGVLTRASATPAQTNPPSRGTLARVRQTGVLHWGGDIQGGEPYVYEDPAHPGQQVGFEVDIANALARELGVRQEFVQADWSNLIPSLERETFDVAMCGIEVTPARSARVLFTRPYFIYTMRLMARRGDPRVSTTCSLRGLRVGTLANSASWDHLQCTGANALPYEGTEEPYIDLSEGRTDAVLIDDLVAERYGTRHPNLRVVGDLGDGYYAIAVRRADPELRDALDDALGRIIRSGELRQILRRWHIDSDRQERLASWTRADTQQMVQAQSRSTFTFSHVLLFLKGALVTLLVSIGAMILAIPLGMGLALLRLYGPRAAGALANAYVELFRGTPVLLQLYVIYYGLAGVLRLDAFSAAIIGLGMNYGAYEAEVYRAGIQAVPRGQMEAAVSLGMSTPLALRRVIMPQAFRLALPSVTNDFIALLKDSSLVSVITVVELTKRMTITAVDTRGWLLPGALCAALYFAMSYPLSRLAQRLEAKLARA